MPQEPGAHEPPEPQHAPPTAPSPTSSGPAELVHLAALKALAQPRRQRILEHLTLHGPATSATLGRALGLNTGSPTTSSPATSTTRSPPLSSSARTVHRHNS
ncbi:hypothetical protein ACFWM5_37775 [Streptomyces bobili]|uniref:hypothetical protein n=1 Tax=Streptomyces bobili TaxID=67280 RepID=UPI003657EDFC